MSAPRIPISEEYWTNKGKDGKKVVIYFHDDLDGIMSAIVMRNYLENKKFEIVAYGVVNYQEGWSNIDIHDNYINIALDFSDNNPKMDVYIDHHGSQFGKDNKDFAIKTATCSAYEGICYQLGIPVDSLILSTIDMVDSAKYQEYGLSFKDTMIFKKEHIYKSRLHYTASLNQIIKRGCYHTLIEVVHNTKSLSVFEIFNNFKKFYPYNNLDFKTNKPKDFIKDGIWRINEMINRTRGRIDKKHRKVICNSQQDFIENNYNNGRWFINGYQIIGNVAFIPSGTWANAIRARGILEQDIEDGIIPKNQIKFIVLQYGTTIQMVCYGNINELNEKYLPNFKEDFYVDNELKAKKGELVTNLGKYMEYVLHNMKTYLGYCDISTHIGSDDDITVAGGHGGIGTISNITGFVETYGAFKYVKFLDLIKNKILKDFSNVKWDNLKMNWQNEKSGTDKLVVNRFKKVHNIRTEKDLKYFKEYYSKS